MANDDSGGNPNEVVEVEFALHDRSYPFVAASDAADCQFSLVEILPHGEERCTEYFEVTGTKPGRVLELADRHADVEAHLLDESTEGGFFEFEVSADCPAVSLARRGALPRTVESAGGEGRIVADVPPRLDPAPLLDSFLAEYDGAEFVSKRSKSTVGSLLSRSARRRVPPDELTERQREVLETALEAGYYEWPRACSGEEVADELGISSATFSEHVHAAERKLLAAVFEGS
jgi:DNA-binding CsgD family transcriptional regulator